jgi:hypothetical protein
LKAEQQPMYFSNRAIPIQKNYWHATRPVSNSRRGSYQ